MKRILVLLTLAAALLAMPAGAIAGARGAASPLGIRS